MCPSKKSEVKIGKWREKEEMEEVKEEMREKKKEVGIEKGKKIKNP